MTCRDCELLLAEGVVAPEIDGHVGTCPECQALAAELRENAVALKAMREEEFESGAGDRFFSPAFLRTTKADDKNRSSALLL